MLHVQTAPSEVHTAPHSQSHKHSRSQPPRTPLSAQSHLCTHSGAVLSSGEQEAAWELWQDHCALAGMLLLLPLLLLNL